MAPERADTASSDSRIQSDLKRVILQSSTSFVEGKLRELAGQYGHDLEKVFIPQIRALLQQVEALSDTFASLKREHLDELRTQLQALGVTEEDMQDSLGKLDAMTPTWMSILSRGLTQAIQLPQSDVSPMMSTSPPIHQQPSPSLSGHDEHAPSQDEQAATPVPAQQPEGRGLQQTPPSLARPEHHDRDQPASEDNEPITSRKRPRESTDDGQDQLQSETPRHNLRHKQPVSYKKLSARGLVNFGTPPPKSPSSEEASASVTSNRKKTRKLNRPFGYSEPWPRRSAPT